MNEPSNATRDLIRRLSAELAHAGRQGRPGLVPVIGIAALLALGPVVLFLGVRPDLVAVLGGIGGLKILAGGLTALCAGLYCAQIWRPDAGKAASLLLLPGIVAFLVPGLLSDPALQIERALVSDAAGPACFSAIVAIALLPLGTMVAGLRRGAPASPFAAGLGAGALSAGLASCAYALHCTADTPTVASFWYPASVVAITLLGGAVGSRWLTW